MKPASGSETLRIFCAKAYRTPAEMTDAKMFAWDGDPASVEAWNVAGFRPVVLLLHRASVRRQRPGSGSLRDPGTGFHSLDSRVR